MRLQYDTLFEVEITHNYFGAGGLNPFSIEPTPSCARGLRDGGLLFRETRTGFCVLYEYRASGPDRIPARSLPEDLKLTFVVSSKSPHLSSYSLLPLGDPEKGIYVLNNLRGTVRNGKYLLTSDEANSFMTGGDRALLRPQRFSYALDNDGAKHVVVVMDAVGVVARRIAVDTAISPAECDVDLSRHQPGLYTLSVDGGECLEFYADSDLFARSPFAVIDLIFGRSVPPGFSPINDDGSVTRKRYTIAIDKRKTYWRYLVVLKYRFGLHPEDVAITYPDPAVVFVRGEVRTTAEGLTVVPFTSDRELPLQRKAVTGITLQKNGNGGAPFAVENLPNASFENLVPDVTTGRIYSDVYVYI
jgi:hypothetical protein